ncbi:MAG: phosphatidylglycerol lysyltransferase domain-containing protein [Solirubrobacteraceae bacterium]
MTLARSAALSVAVIAVDSVIAGLATDGVRGARSHPAQPALLAESHVLAIVLGLALLGLTPRVWRGTRTAVALTIGGLLSLAALNLWEGRYRVAIVQACLAVMLGLARGAFREGCSNRPRPALAGAAVAAWGLAGATVLAARLARGTASHVIARVLHHPVIQTLPIRRLDGGWNIAIEVLIAVAAAVSALAVRSVVRPAPAVNGHREDEHRRARAIVDAYGSDSLSPFLLRPDKALVCAAGGVLSYKVIGETAVVSADPVAPPGAAPAVLAAFLHQARRRGWQVVVWGATARHLAGYRALGLRAVCAGEEAFVDPRTFNLEGRAVRKLRQSVNRVARRGWTIGARAGRDIDSQLESEIEALRREWCLSHPRVHGFAMGMGMFAGEIRADDLYLLARSPEGRLGAVMRFVPCGDNLSLDTMERVGETPNGLNEALVAAALEAAGALGVAEVSLNYAGLAHLIRREPSSSPIVRALTRIALIPLHRRFALDRLVRFNDKFAPEWRPRYLVYASPATLPRAVVRVLQAEGYLGHGGDTLPGRSPQTPLRGLPAAHRPRRPVGESR